MGVYRLGTVACAAHMSFWHAVWSFAGGVLVAALLMGLVFLVAFAASYVDDRWKNRNRRG